MAAMVLQLLAVVFHTPGSSRLVVPDAVAGLHSVLICTAHGTQSITLDADGNPAESPSEPGDSGSRCQICNVLGSLSLTAPVDRAALDAPRSSHFSVLIEQYVLPAGTDAGIHRNRGPPSRSVV